MTAGSRLWSAALAGLAALGIGAPQLSAAETCQSVLTSALSPGAQLGWSVDAHDKWLVGGAPLASSGGTIVMFEGPSHQRVPLPAPADLQPGDRFGFSVSIHGDWLAVGAPSGDGHGVVYIFQHDGGTWQQYQNKLEAEDAAPNAQFGFSVSLHNKTLVVGAPDAPHRGTRAGAAYVFELFDNGIWTQRAALSAAGGQPFDTFGASVAVSDDTLVVGAPFADDPGAVRNFGAAYVFARNQSGWSQMSKLTAGVFREENIQFGAAVAMHGTRIAVGAPGDDLSGKGSGRAFVFEWDGASWNRHELKSGDPGLGEQFGTSVDLDATHLAVGARYDRENETRAGAAYLFRKNGTSWEQTQKLIHATEGSSFGQSVAILRTTVYSGGPFYPGAGAIAVCVKETDPDPKPILECAKSGPASVVAGATMTYTIDIHNKGNATAAGLKLIDPPPGGLIFVPSPGKLCGKGFPCRLAPLAPDRSHRIEVKFRVPSVADCGANPAPIENVAHVSAEGGFNTTCTAAPTLIQVPTAGALACENISESSATPGNLVYYEITVSNTGCEDVRDVVLEDPTPDGLLFHSIGPPCAELLLPCKLGTIQPGKSVKVIARFLVLEGCRDSVENIARVSGSGGLQETCSFETVLAGADLAVDVNVPASNPGGRKLEVPISISNTGPRKARNVGLTVDIQLPGSVRQIPPVCTATTPGRFDCALGEIACGDPRPQPLTFVVQAQVDPACAVPGSIQVHAKLRSDGADPDDSNNSDQAEIQVACSIQAIPTLSKEAALVLILLLAALTLRRLRAAR